MCSSQLSATTEHVRLSRLLPPDAHTHPAHSRGLSQSDGSILLSISWPAGGGASLCKQREDAAPLIASSLLLLLRLYAVRNHSRNRPGPNWSRVVRNQSRTPVRTGPELPSPAGGPVSPAESCRWTRWALAHSIHSHGVSSSIGPHVTFDPGTLTRSSEDQQHKGVCAAGPAYSGSDQVKVL